MKVTVQKLMCYQMYDKRTEREYEAERWFLIPRREDGSRNDELIESDLDWAIAQENSFQTRKAAIRYAKMKGYEVISERRPKTNKRIENKRLKDIAQDILIIHIQNAHDFLEEYCANHAGEPYSEALQEAVRKEAARLAKSMGFVKVPGIIL